MRNDQQLWIEIRAIREEVQTIGRQVAVLVSSEKRRVRWTSLAVGSALTAAWSFVSGWISSGKH